MDSRVHGNDDGWREGRWADFLRDSGVVDVFCLILCYSNFFRITSLCQPLSVSQLVILADAGIHRTASVVARYYHFVTGIVVGFALCCCLLWQVRFQTRHPACVDEWIPVCTGMTTGGVKADGLIFYGIVALLMCFVSSFVIPTSSV
ncbi:hypothetical protein [Vibrio vulnificus]|uniref:hypothetical protein n=1 Tax=Vibrio vulnificus TaxID=672 RepID=UPI0013EE96D5|nr:hypothetical protein [Vibrio vulnificus]